MLDDIKRDKEQASKLSKEPVSKIISKPTEISIANETKTEFQDESCDEIFLLHDYPDSLVNQSQLGDVYRRIYGSFKSKRSCSTMCS